MRKKDKLYTVNKFNAPLFAQNVDRENNNIFDGLDSSLITSPGLSWNEGVTKLGDYTYNGVPVVGAGDYLKQQGMLNPGALSPNSSYKIPGAGDIKIPQVPTAVDSAAKSNAFWNKAKGYAGAASMLGNIPTKDGNLFNTMDPLHHLAGGRESAVGNTLHTAGQGLFQAGAQSGNGWLMLAGGVAQGVGSLWNGAFGAKWNKENIANVENNIANMRGTGQNIGYVANSTDLLNRWGDVNFGTDFNTSYIGKNGWFNHKATRKANKLRRQQNIARDVAMHNLTTAAKHGDRNIDAIARRNTFAYGGPLEQLASNGNMGAIEYGFMSDYLKGKQDQNSVKNNMNNMFMGMPSSWFAEGGGIEIKHPGRLTELKKRTGKTEAELWAEGKPDVRKMITFARNARKWQKAYGGFLDATDNLFPNGGELKPEQRIENGLIYDERPRESVSSSGYRHVEDPNSTYAVDEEGNIVDYSTRLPEFTLSMDNRNIQKKMADAYGKHGRNPKYHSTLEENVKEGYKFFWPGLMRFAPTTLGAVSLNLPALLSKLPESIPYEELPDGLINAVNAITASVHPLTEVGAAIQEDKKSSGGTLFALGGDVQNKGADFTTGLTRIDAGGTHEENPYDGVQVGVDSEGTPNKLEEGETVYNDYVFSMRIPLDEEAKKDLHLPMKRDIPYAEAPKIFEKEAAERPNDPISQAAFKKKMEKLQEHQERQKAEMEAARAREAFEALSPEEQANLMQYAQQQEQAQEEAMNEQAMQEQAMQEQAMAEQQGMGMSPEEQMYQEQMMAQQQGGMPMDSMMQGYPEQGYAQEGYACGGKINRFDRGGDMKKQLMTALGLYTEGDFQRWAEKNKIDIKDWDWEKALQNQAFVGALTKDNSALAHVINTGKYDFGAYIPPSTAQLTFTGPDGKSYMDSGNWTTANADHPYVGWKGSHDPINLEFEEYMKGKYGDKWEEEAMKMSRKDLEDTFKQMPSYQRTTKYLQDSADNILAYLNAVKNDPNIKNHPNAIKHYQKFINDDGTWKEGVDTSDVMKLYNDVFGEGSGNSGRIFYPGTYWHTPTGMNRNKQVKNWVKGPDGWELIEGDVPSNWKRLQGYSWANPETDLEYNYYERPGSNAGGEKTVTLPDGRKAKVDENGKVVDDGWVATPNYKNENLRYLGLLGPAVGLGLWGLGVGKPNYKDLNAAVEAGNVGGALADYKPVGNYKKYQPLDLYMQQNRNAGMIGANARGINNTAATSGTKQAQQLANTYAGLMANGDLGVKARQYDDALNTQALDINNKVDMFNADAYNRTSLTNAELRNRNRQFRAQLGMQAAAQKMAADAAWNQGLYGNISGLFKGLSDLGRENAQHNMIAEMAADGLFGIMSPRTNVGRRGKYINWDRNPNYTAAEGGKINKKKNKRRGGLTY